MNFSNNAQNYFRKLKRESNIGFDREMISHYLKLQNINPFEKIIEFQMEFAGLELTIKNKPDETFVAHLFAKDDILNNKEIDVIENDGRLYFNCGEHSTAQFWFMICETGEICTYDNNDETINSIFSNFEKFVESYAMKNFLAESRKYEHPYYFDLMDTEKFDIEIKDFSISVDESDVYNKWYSNNKLIIQKGVWYDRPSPFIHLFGDEKNECEDFINQCKIKSIIK